MFTIIEVLAISGLMSVGAYMFGVKHGFEYGFKRGGHEVIDRMVELKIVAAEDLVVALRKVGF